MYQNIQLRQDTLENWNKVPGVILKAGEVALVSTSNNSTYDSFKIGNGSTEFVNLPLYRIIKTDDNGNPLFIDPLTKEAIDILSIISAYKTQDLRFNPQFIDAIDSMSFIEEGVLSIDGPIFSNTQVQDSLEIGRGYVFYEEGIYSLIQKISDNNFAILWHEANRVYFITLQSEKDSLGKYSTQVYCSQYKNAQYFNIKDTYTSTEFSNYKSIISLYSRDKIGYMVFYKGQSYIQPKIDGQGNILLTNIQPIIQDNVIKGLGYNTLVLGSGGEIGSHTYYVETFNKPEDIAFKVEVPYSIWELSLKEVKAVEEVWGSVRDFQKWVDSLDPYKIGLKSWDIVVSDTNGTITGKMIKSENPTVGGVVLTDYFISLEKLNEDSTLYKHYRLYNNPDNNTVPIGDVIVCTSTGTPSGEFVQSDWDEENLDSPSFILNRTHFKKEIVQDSFTIIPVDIELRFQVENVPVEEGEAIPLSYFEMLVKVFPSGQDIHISFEETLYIDPTSGIIVNEVNESPFYYVGPEGLFVKGVIGVVFSFDSALTELFIVDPVLGRSSLGTFNQVEGKVEGVINSIFGLDPSGSTVLNTVSLHKSIIYSPLDPSYLGSPSPEEMNEIFELFNE